MQTTFSNYSPQAPTGCAGGIHLLVRYTGSPTFQPGTCKPSNNIGLCPQVAHLSRPQRHKAAILQCLLCAAILAYVQMAGREVCPCKITNSCTAQMECKD